MSNQNIPDQTIRKYLLSQATAPEQDSIEMRLITSRRFCRYVKMIEDELIDDYAFGRLTPQASRRFQSHFRLSPERLLSLHFSQAMRSFIPGIRRRP